MNKVIMILVIITTIVVGYGIYSVGKTASNVGAELEKNRKNQTLYYEEMLKKI